MTSDKFTTLIIQSTETGSRNINLTNVVPKTATVSDLEQIIQDREGGMLKNPTFVYNGKPLKDKTKKLTFYKIRDNSTIFCPLKLKGGTQQPDREKRFMDKYQEKLLSDKTNYKLLDIKAIKNLINTSRLKKRNLELTDKHCVNGIHDSCDTDNEKIRIKMPGCKKDHIQCYNCLKQYVYASLFMNGDTMLECRTKCDELDFDDLSAVLNWTDKDEQLILQALSKNSLKYAAVQVCPNTQCGQYIIKNENVRGNRVKCPTCNGKDFCWKCRKEWTATGNDDCGYDECKNTYAAFLNLVLDPEHSGRRDCPTSGAKGIPVMRLCPGCKTLWEWSDKCRHITCKNDSCGHNYCQKCLAPFNHNAPCPCRYCRTIFKDITPCTLSKTCVEAPTQSTKVN